QNRQDHYQNKKGERDGGAIAAVVILEGLTIDQLNQDHRRIAASAGGEQVDLIEYLQLQDELDGQHQCGDGPDQRPGYQTELLPSRGSIEGGRVVDILRDVAKPRDKQKDVESVRPPDGYEGDCGQEPRNGPEHRYALPVEEFNDILANAELQ